MSKWVVVAVLVLAAVLIAPGPAGANGDSVVSVPLHFDVPDGNRLYVYGELTPSVSLTSSRAGSLLLNGAIVNVNPMGAPKRHPTLSDEALSRIYGDVPYFRDLLERGAFVQEAGVRFHRELRRLSQSAYDAYTEAIASGLSSVEASGVARDAMLSADTLDLVYVDPDCEFYDAGFRYRERGIVGMAGLTLPDAGQTMRRPGPSASSNAGYVEWVSSSLVLGVKPCWCFIHRSGEIAFVGRQMVDAVGAQVESALASGSASDYPLDAAPLAEVIAASGEAGK